MGYPQAFRGCKYTHQIELMVSDLHKITQAESTLEAPYPLHFTNRVHFIAARIVNKHNKNPLASVHNMDFNSTTQDAIIQSSQTSKTLPTLDVFTYGRQ
jgi:hypothetical protein